MQRTIIFLPFFVLAACQSPRPAPDAQRSAFASAGIPVGIYALGGGDAPRGNTLDLPFVDGWVSRMPWTALEKAKGSYDFSRIDAIIAAVEAKGKRLTLDIFTTEVPADILSQPGAQTYTGRAVSGKEVLTSAPWDEYALQRWEAFCKALAAHQLPDQSRGGQLVALADHPTLAQLDTPMPGLQGIRDIGERIPAAKGYSRDVFITAAKRAIHAMVDSFPAQRHHLSFFDMSDSQRSPSLGHAVYEAMAAEFDSGAAPQLAFFQENLACSTPSTSFAYALLDSKTPAAFQMLQAWVSPHLNAANTDPCLVTTVPGDRSSATSGPEVGIKYGYETFGSRYFELYVDDLNHAPFANALQAWHDKLLGSVGDNPQPPPQPRADASRGACDAGSPAPPDATLAAGDSGAPNGSKLPLCPAGAGNATSYRRLAYARNDGRNVLDLWVPADPGQIPLVIWVHGGGWQGGSRAEVPAFATALLDRGYALASIDYRLSDIPWPAPINDVKAAIRFLRANAAKYRLDPARFAIWGSSAGGHLAALAGTSAGVSALEDPRQGNASVSAGLQAVIDFYGPTNFAQMDQQAQQANCGRTLCHNCSNSPESLLLDCSVQAPNCQAQVSAADPTSYIDSSDPPFLIVHGGKDCLVPSAQSRNFNQALQQAGLESTLIEVPDGVHGNAAPPQGTVTAEVVTTAQAFLDRHLRGCRAN